MRNIVDEKTVVVVQGITGNEGRFHAEAMLKYGTKVAAGVTPGKGGQQVHGVPVYNTVAEAVRLHGVNTSMVLVPAKFAPAAVNESIDAGLRTVVVITESIPQKDSIEFIARAQRQGTIIVGPNTPGTIAPPLKVKVGIMPSHVFSPGAVGIASRSGTLVYEIAWHITEARLGQSLCTGIGGDPVTGLDFVMVLEMFRKHEGTKGVVLVGEVGGRAEELAAEYIVDTKYPKPVVAYIAGRSAPPEKRMGHAGAIVVGNVGTAKSKVEALTEAGVTVADKPSDIPRLLKARL
ncbi:MAG: succinate--CoA ligase subunit alpha [Chloroflexi bacterium]|nr:succinate--CoA ligase subunit alpha [Chloroflexota bacterium]